MDELLDKIAKAVLYYEDTDPGYSDWMFAKEKDWKEDIRVLIEGYIKENHNG